MFPERLHPTAGGDRCREPQANFRQTPVGLVTEWGIEFMEESRTPKDDLQNGAWVLTETDPPTKDYAEGLDLGSLCIGSRCATCSSCGSPNNWNSHSCL